MNHILWIYAGFEADGSFINYPGTSSEPTPYDPRKRDWYQSTKAANRLHWVKPYYESGQNSLVISVAKPLYHPVDHRLFGVVAIDLLMHELVEDVLAPGDGHDIEYILFGNDGMVVARSGYDHILGHWTEVAPAENITEVLKGLGLVDPFPLENGLREILFSDGEPRYVYSAKVKEESLKLVSIMNKGSLSSKRHATLESISSLGAAYGDKLHGILIRYGKLIYLHLLMLGAMVFAVYYVLKRTVTNPFEHLVQIIGNIGSGRPAAKDRRYLGQYEYASIADALIVMQNDMETLQRDLQRQRTNAQIGQIASQIAHDIRSPLSVLKALVERLASGMPLQDQESDILGAAQRSVVKLLNMADDMLDYSKAQQIRVIETNVNVLVEEVMNEAAPEAAKGGVALKPEAPTTLRARFDAEKMGRVLANMLLNAIQAHQGPGSVSIKLGAQRGDLIVSISDTGQGIAPEHLGKVFDRSFTFGKAGGTGLGLAYCKQVVEAHGGRIEVASEVGKGTTFTIVLPGCVVEAGGGSVAREISAGAALAGAPAGESAVAASAAKEAAAAAGDEGRSGGKAFRSGARSERPNVAPPKAKLGNVLIADDDFGIRLQWVDVVKRLGGTVVCAATSPEELMEVAGEFDYSAIDAAIVDHQFEGEGRDGIDLVAYLRSKGVERVHLCTGHHDDEELRRRAEKVGAVSVIPKPIDFATVEKHIRG